MKNTTKFYIGPNGNEYATSAALAEALSIKSHDQVSEIMNNINEKFCNYDDNFPTFYFEDDDSNLDLKINGSYQPIKGIRIDIFMDVVASIKACEDTPVEKAGQFDKSVQKLKDYIKSLGLKISTSSDILQAVQPMLENKQMEIDSLKRTINNLENTIVIRKNKPYVDNPLNHTSIQDFGIDPKPQLKYVTDKDGVNYADYQKWLQEDPNHKPDVPKH